MPELYDTIGRGYSEQRRPDPRILRYITTALGDARSVVNVGAGTGSYEPLDREVVAVEPSPTMIRQRPPGFGRPVCASAPELPFRDGAFDASLAVLTVHHWPDQTRGLQELRRVARRRSLLLTWAPDSPGFWLGDYFPGILDIDRQIFPSLEQLAAAMGRVHVTDVPIPHDCVDGFLGAYWRRPHAYLDERVRAGMSTFCKLDPGPGLRRLRDDLASGAWHRRYGDLADQAETDLGYRLVVAGEPARACESTA